VRAEGGRCVDEASRATRYDQSPQGVGSRVGNRGKSNSNREDATLKGGATRAKSTDILSVPERIREEWRSSTLWCITMSCG
jgi:hypothetical protein